MSENNIVNSNAEQQEIAATPEVAESAASKNVPVEAPATAHDDFDWSVDKRNVTHYSADEKAQYDAVYDGTFKQVNDGEMVNGQVVGITKTDVVVNIGFKSDGLVSLNEFRDTP
jgi:small subunit ribosomal protein S1